MAVTSRFGFGADQGTSGRAIELVGDSPEIVALALLRQIAQAERRLGTTEGISREWLLDTYAECLAATRGERGSANRGRDADSPRKAVGLSGRRKGAERIRAAG